MFRWVVVIAFVLGAAGTAWSQTVAAACGAGYAVRPGEKCMFIARGLTQTGGETSAGPIILNIKDGERFSNMCVAYGNAAASCEPGIATVLWSAKTGAAAPAVWNTLTSLTGIVSPLVSGYCGPIVGPNVMATLDGDANGSQSAITDTDCNSSNGVDLVVILYP